MPPRKLQADEKLDALRACVDQGSQTQALDCLRETLQDQDNFVVAKAAEITADRQAVELLPELRATFDRLAGDDAQRVDKTCLAKNALARAMYELDYDDVAFYRRYLRFRQLEPGYGAATDSAVDLRCTCALGLVASGTPDAVLELLGLLNDAEWHARIGAIRALEQVDPFHAQIALRQKIVQGDEEPEVIAQCFSSLLKAAGEEALSFALEWLNGTDRIRQEVESPEVCNSAAGTAGESVRQGG